MARATRTYDHFCVLARALERVGDRWTLLVVRDLLGGPRRFTDLMARLGGITPKTLAQRLRELTDRFIEGVKAKGYHVVSPRDKWQWSGIVSFTSPAHDAKRVVVELRKAHQTEIALREGRLRASPHFYNTEEQIDRLVDHLPRH